jgi:5-methylthioribose kinase
MDDNAHGALPPVGLALTYCQTQSSLLPAPAIEAVQLSGGLVNYVYRILSSTGSSYILKQYPPFLSSNPQITFSQDRYYVEKAALSLSSHVTTTSLLVPSLLFSYDAMHVLIMEDAGDIKALFNLLKVGSEMPSLLIEHEVPSVLASFLRRLASVEIPTHFQTTFDNRSKDCLLIEAIFEPYAERVAEYACLLKFAPMVTLEKEAIQARLSLSSESSSTRRSRLCFEDFWPNSICFNKSGHVVVIDWEFSSFGRVESDAYQLICYLWLMEQDSDGRYDICRVSSCRSYLEQQFEGSTSDICALLVNFALIFKEEKFWRFNDLNLLTNEFEKFVSHLLESCC